MIKYYVVYLDENMIDSPPFDTYAEAKEWMKENPEYLESNGEPLDSFAVQLFDESEIGDPTP